VLNGRIAVVTGGGRGLGRAVAVALAEAGAKVAVASRTREELEDTVSIIADKGGQAIAIKADVSDPGDVKNLCRAVEMKFGPPSILVNNAGITGPVAWMKDISDPEFQRCMDINLIGAWLVSKACIPGMIKKRSGKIINMTSGLADFVIPRLGAYSISKSGLNALTKVLARELEQYNIKVYGMDPGSVDTRMHDDIRKLDMNVLGPDAYRVFWGLKKSGQLKQPSEVAKLAVFLASDQSDELSGEIGTEDHFMKWGYRTAA
jgi:NAD(P)-dependent dehydrogenase (short-subunit alcohol dehydrogenase family)